MGETDHRLYSITSSFMLFPILSVLFSARAPQGTHGLGMLSVTCPV